MDDGRETARGLWTPAARFLAGPATLAVETVPPLWTTGREITCGSLIRLGWAAWADVEYRGERRKRPVSEHVERLVQAGASLAWRTDDVRGSSVTLYDP